MLTRFSSIDLSLAVVFLIKVSAAAVGVTSAPDVRRRRLPSSAAWLWLAVAIPSVAQLRWPQLLVALRRDPDEILHHGQYWRLLTAVVVQDGGVAGTACNLVSLGVLAVLGCWFWGGRRAVTVFLVAGVLLNLLGAVYGSVGAGSSGATFALAASVAGAALIHLRGRVRLAAGATLGFGALMWWVLDDPHGIAILLGGVAGSALGAAQRPCSHRDLDEPSAADPAPRLTRPDVSS